MTAATQTEVVIVIPGTPPRGCWPNYARRLHWSERAKAARAWRETAGWATVAAKAADLHGFMLVTSSLEIVMDVAIAWPKGQRRLDDDNAWGAMKNARDGIADVLGVNDRWFRVGTMTQIRGSGVVTVTLREGDEAATVA